MPRAVRDRPVLRAALRAARGRRPTVPGANDVSAPSRPRRSTTLRVPGGRTARSCIARRRRSSSSRAVTRFGRRTSFRSGAGIRSSAFTSPCDRRARWSGRGERGAARSRSSTRRPKSPEAPGPHTTRSSTPRRWRDSEAYLGSLTVDGADVPSGVAAGLLEEDVRVRDALRELAARGTLELPRPTTIETASFAIEAAVLGEADVIRTQRWLDDLERRVGRLERTTPVRIERRLRTLARRAFGR